jgi:hypothetical protein
MNSMIGPTTGGTNGPFFLSSLHARRKERERQRKGERGELNCLFA